MSGNLERILVLSIWDGFWSLGEGCGVPDEIYFMKALSRMGIAVDYLMPEPASESREPQIEGVAFHRYKNVFNDLAGLPGPVRRVAVPLMYSRAVMPALRRLAEKNRPGLLLGYTYYALRPLSIIGRELGIPTAVKLFGVMYLNRREIPFPRYWWLNYEQIFSLRYPVDRYIVLNDGTQGREALVSRGIDPGRITFLPNGMDMSWQHQDVDREACRKELGLPRDKVLLVTFSRLVRSKRIDLFLEALAKLPDAAMEKAAAVIGGDGPERAALEAMAARLGITERVFFTGAIKYADVPGFLKCCDVFVGTNELTNMSMPPCEALLCGLPVAAFDTAGTSETIRDGENGLLAAHGDTRALAVAIERLILDRQLRERLGKAASASAAGELMSWEERNAREIEILRETAATP